jgi:WD40 repeat protein
MYDLKSGKCTKRFDGHLSEVNCLKLLDDGRVASGSNDNTIKIWNREAKCEFTLKDRGSGYILCLEELKDARSENVLLSGSFDRKIRAWDLAKRVVTRTFEGHSDWITVIKQIPSSTSNQFMSGSYDKTIKIWNINSISCGKTLIGHTDYVIDLEFDWTTSTIISCSYDKTIRCWYENGSVRLFDELTANLTCLKLTINGEYVLSGDKDGNIKVWNVSKGECVNVISTEVYVTRLEMCPIK